MTCKQAKADLIVVTTLQIHLACPQTLLPVLPLLAHELQVEVEAKRLDAIDLLGKLFTLPGSDMDQEYSYLFEEFLRRCKDQKVTLVLLGSELPLQCAYNCTAYLWTSLTCNTRALQSVLSGL